MSDQSTMQDEHRLFVQVMMSKRILTKEDAKEIVEEKLSSAGQTLSRMVSTVNQSLDPFGLKVQEGKAESDGSAYLALVNLKDDDKAAMIANPFSPAEIEYFKTMLELFLEEASDSGLLSSMTLTNIPHQMEKKMTVKQAEEFVDKLKDGLWIVEEEELGQYSAGPRLLLEFRPLLQSDDRVVKCHACQDIVLRGEMHTIDGHPRKYHMYCAERMFRGGQPRNSSSS